MNPGPYVWTTNRLACTLATIVPDVKPLLIFLIPTRMCKSLLCVVFSHRSPLFYAVFFPSRCHFCQSKWSTSFPKHLRANRLSHSAVTNSEALWLAATRRCRGNGARASIPIGQKFRRRRVLKGIKGSTGFDVRATLKFGGPEESRPEDVRGLEAIRRRSDDGAAQTSCVESSI